MSWAGFAQNDIEQQPVWRYTCEFTLMTGLQIKHGDRLIKSYYEVLGQYGQLHIDHEMAVRSAFQSVLRGYSKKLDWTLVPEYSLPLGKGKRIVVDGVLLDTWRFRRGFWEAKDEQDDLDREVKLKIEKGYPRSNTIFQAPDRAILYQRGVRQGLNEDIRDPKNLAVLLTEFFGYREPDHEEWDAAVREFKERIPELAGRAEKLIESERAGNRAFRERFEAFYDLCRQAINPNLSAQTVEKMLIQHLLTERIFRRVFKAEEFRSRNVIAAEIEKVIQSLTSRHFSRDQFLTGLDYFYKAIERAADDKEEYSEKQAFLNTVYERFFQGYSPKEADTHGIVYTPQPIVDFMVRSVDDILKKEFGKSLADRGVHILDPFVGTGNFVVRVMKQIGEMRRSALPWKYQNELHCNEIMLLPYYIASMNIEHEYAEQTGQYDSFNGICLTDTFELAEPEQSGFSFMSEENTARVKKQKEAPIFVVIGNPPYNAGQTDESDNNKNRKYPAIDRRVSSTYARDSRATLLRKLQDPYVKAIRWATDRVGNEGMVVFVSNNSFIHDHSMDGMRAHLEEDFDRIYLLDLGGNVRKNPKLSGTTHNVFGIQIGVSINIFVRKAPGRRPAEIWYKDLESSWRKEQKYAFLDSSPSISELQLERVVPDECHTWLREGVQPDFATFCRMANKKKADALSIFRTYSLGVSTNRDAVAYNFSADALASTVAEFVEGYSAAVSAFRRKHPKDVDEFLSTSKMKWSRNLKRHLKSCDSFTFSAACIRTALYRPFTKVFLYLADILVDEAGDAVEHSPSQKAQNCTLLVTDVAGRSPFTVLTSDCVVDLHTCASSDGFQSFPYYTYEEDGTNRRENITDWALEEFRKHYNDRKIGKWDIFYYTYAVLHHPEYRERYAANLKRELPRIPYALEFWAFAKAGERLADLHVNYEKQPEFPLQRVENPDEQLSLRVEKMRLGKDKTSLVYNSFLTLRGIPPEIYEYRLGNRSALEWIVDQYQVSTDKRSGITNDPNREDDPEYIVRLIGQVVHVSVETVKLLKTLPDLGIGKDLASHTQASV